MDSADSKSGAKKKVLIVDDDTDYTEACSLILEKAGFEVAVVHSGEECHKVVGDVAPDVILLDMMMETWSEGSNVVKRLRESENTKHIPIILASAVDFRSPIGDTSATEDFMGVDGYMTKPVEPAKLVEQITRLVNSE